MPVQLKVSLEIFSQINEESPPVQAPYKADTKQTAAIFENGFEIGLYRGRSLICIQLHPFQITKEVRIKKRLAAISSNREYLL